jgi:phospholipid/cholesterol/gamma-HCH transport system ATP-binding protein
MAQMSSDDGERAEQSTARGDSEDALTSEHAPTSEYASASEHTSTSEHALDGDLADRGGSRVSVIDEAPPRPAPPRGVSEEEYKWHSYKVYPSGRPDAIEFIDIYKSFGRAHILRGLNMGLPEGMVSMIIGPSGTGKSVCIKHMVGLLYPDDGDVLVHGESVPSMADDDLFDMRKKFGLLFGRDAQTGRVRPRAGARARHRPVRRARLRP